MAQGLPQLKTTHTALAGGLDLVSPAISLDPGKVIDSQNYEPYIQGGYRRITGYERYDGRPSPTAQPYWILPVSTATGFTVGGTITGSSSGTTGVVLGIFSNVTGESYTNYLVLGRVAGSGFTTLDTVAGQSVLAIPIQNAASVPSDHADYALLAANDYRTLIQVVPGSGPVRGVWMYNDVVYAFRDNAAGTANLMYKATSTGWSLVSFPIELKFVPRTGNVTVTAAAPGVVTFNSHGAANGTQVSFGGTTVPGGLTAGTVYFVVASAANTFQVSATMGGAAITTTTTGSGVTCTLYGNAGTVSIGQTITGVSSLATAVLTGALLMTGTWTTQPVGTFVMTSVTGTFVTGEAITVGGQLVAQANGTNTPMVRSPGGKYTCQNYNFSGYTGGTKMYGCDGVNPFFEFDGTNFYQIRTGMSPDTPQTMICYKGYLLGGFGALIEFSSITNPYQWSVVTGAGQFGVNDTVTGFLPQGGTSSGPALAVFTRKSTWMLYGNVLPSGTLIPSVFEIGFNQYTMQQISNDAYGLTARGIQSLITTLAYGDFDYESVSHMIQPYITRKLGKEIASNTLRSTNQYRVYFNDGSALAVGLTGDKVTALLPLYYQNIPQVIFTANMSNGAEVTYFGSDSGYVYQDQVGTSQDGLPIEAWVRLPFNNMGSPQIRKRFQRGVLELVVESFSQVNISYDLGYGTNNINPPAPQIDQVLSGQGGYWDQFTWDSFNWDTQLVTNPSLEIDGTEKNISLMFYSQRAQDGSHVLQGVTWEFFPRRIER